MVAVRTMGLGLESLIGYQASGQNRLVVDGKYLVMLLEVANERFAENRRRTERFREALRSEVARQLGSEGREEPEVRRERKRLEGMRRAEEVRRLRIQKESGLESSVEEDLMGVRAWHI